MAKRIASLLHFHDIKLRHGCQTFCDYCVDRKRHRRARAGIIAAVYFIYYTVAVIWLIMMAVSIGLMIFTNPSAAVNSMVSGAHGAVELSLNLLALYAFWLGFFSLIEKLGLSRGLERLLRPVIVRLFPSADAETRKFITMNISANILGLGNAATPMAINAINRMDDGNPKASTDMIMLTVISATSLQILPTTVIGMRATAGSASPADFIFPSLIATVLSTVIGIVGVKLCAKIFDRDKEKCREKRELRKKARAEKRAALAAKRAQRESVAQAQRTQRTQRTQKMRESGVGR